MRYEHIFFSPVLLSTYIRVGANERFLDYWELIVLKSGKEIGRDAFYCLKKEKNVQLDIRGYCKLETCDIWISSYSAYIKDFILYRYYNDSYVVFINNVHSVESYVDNIHAVIRGSEISCNYQLNDNLSLKSDISYVFVKNITNDSSLPQLPPLETKMTLIWKYGL